MSKMMDNFVAYVERLEETVERQQERINTLALLNYQKDSKIEILEETIEILRKEKDSR